MNLPAWNREVFLSGTILPMIRHEYRLLDASDVEQAAQVIAHSFVDDPLVSFMLPFKATRIRTMIKFFRAYGELGIRDERGFGVGEPLQGVAFWKFPEHEDLSVSIRSLGRFVPILFTMYPIGYFRARAALERIDDLHQRHAQEPHFYLDNIGVLPSARGRGMSSKLIRPFLEMSDDQKVPAYTDTVTRANVLLYEHFGFNLVEESPVEGTGITVHALKRDPR
jgi:ribosomal protein S18 acetylase RimI-like enzyme